MMQLQSNVSFALLDTCATWRTDLTTRFCEYFAFQFHGDEFRDFVSLPGTIDQALKACKLPYLIVMKPGYVPLSKTFFKKLEEQLIKNEDIFLGHIYLIDDYVIIDPKFIVFNMAVWKKAGCPSFAAAGKTLVRQFVVSSKSNDRDWPHEIISTVTGVERQQAERFCRENGAVLISKQLELFSRVTSISALAPEECHFFDDATALGEIVSETEFEHIHLPLAKSVIRLIDNDALDDIPDRFNTEVLVAYASGLRTLDIVAQIKPKKVILYSSNVFELELQKRLFEVKTARLYGEIIDEFLLDNPEATIQMITRADRHLVIKPIKNVELECKVVSLFSFQILDLVRSIHHNTQAVFDFADAFINPINYYRRPLYQVQGLFATLYSDIRSRTGISRIFGYAPGFKRMNSVIINTSNAAFEFSASCVELEPSAERPQIFRPESSPQIKEKLIAKSFFQRIKSAMSSNVMPDRKPASWESRATRLGYQFDTKNPNGLLNVFKVNEPIGDLRFVYFYEIDEATNKWAFRVGINGEPKRILIEDGSTQNSFIAHMLRDSKIDPVAVAKMLGK